MAGIKTEEAFNGSSTQHQDKLVIIFSALNELYGFIRPLAQTHSETRGAYKIQCYKPLAYSDYETTKTPQNPHKFNTIPQNLKEYPS